MVARHQSDARHTVVHANACPASLLEVSVSTVGGAAKARGLQFGIFTRRPILTGGRQLGWASPFLCLRTLIYPAMKRA